MIACVIDLEVRGDSCFGIKPGIFRSPKVIEGVLTELWLRDRHVRPQLIRRCVESRSPNVHVAVPGRGSGRAPTSGGQTARAAGSAASAPVRSATAAPGPTNLATVVGTTKAARCLPRELSSAGSSCPCLMICWRSLSNPRSRWSRRLCHRSRSRPLARSPTKRAGAAPPSSERSGGAISVRAPFASAWTLSVRNRSPGCPVWALRPAGASPVVASGSRRASARAQSRPSRRTAAARVDHVGLA